MDIGRQGWIGIGTEDTWGDPVAIEDYVPYNDNAPLTAQTTPIAVQDARGTRRREANSEPGPKWSEGTLAQNVDEELIGYSLYGVFGNLSTSTVSGSVKDHDFTQSEESDPVSFTFTQAHGDIDKQYYCGVMYKNFALSLSDGLATASSELRGKFPITTSSGSVTTSSGSVFTFADNHFAFGASASGALSATNLAPSELNITVENNTQVIHRHGDNNPHSINHGEFEATGDGLLFFENTTQRDRYYNTTKQAAALKLTGTGIGSGQTASLTFRLFRTRFESRELETGLADFFAERFNLVCETDENQGEAINATLRNTKASY